MKYTIEDIFRIVKERAKTEKRSIDNRCTCKYRSMSGDKCFIGELIPDEMYKPEIEGMLASDLLELPEFKNLFEDSPLLKMILNRMQIIHDAYDTHIWGSKIEELERDIKSSSDYIIKLGVE
jgi:hypothetical protein